MEHVIRSGRTIGFAGDYIWMDMFKDYFNETYPFPSFNVRDLDSLDLDTFEKLHYLLDREEPHDLMIGHVSGIDHAGHTHGSDNEHIERKILETEDQIRQLISKLDDETTLIVFGDHGMTPGGNHGGGSEFELRSVLFAYRKAGFPNEGFAGKHL
jgi:phosphatidylinositol glycan class O